jgi:putative ABC transport system permease protein
MFKIPLGWLQLKKEKPRFAVALAGVSFAVVLILMQLGFRDSMFESAVRYHRRMLYEIALFSPESEYIARPASFSRRRLYQTLAVEGVEAVSPIRISLGNWKNPYTYNTRRVLILGIDPADQVFDQPGIRSSLEKIRRQDVILFDEASRPEYGPIGERFEAGEEITVEVNDREVEVGGLFTMGTSFGIDGSIVTSDSNFLRLFPNRRRGLIELGLIHLRRGADVEAVRNALRALLPVDVLVLTKTGFVEREKAYWDATTPIGYVFAFGAIVGLLVGAIIVYQILFADVSDHFEEYATLKALGYSNLYLSGVVIQQAVILAALGYIPGLAVALWLYRTAGAATHLPLYMTTERALVVLALTVGMCCVSGLIALRKVRAADPAEIF